MPQNHEIKSIRNFPQQRNLTQCMFITYCVVQPSCDSIKIEKYLSIAVTIQGKTRLTFAKANIISPSLMDQAPSRENGEAYNYTSFIKSSLYLCSFTFNSQPLVWTVQKLYCRPEAA